jgi:hypothetical protein
MSGLNNISSNMPMDDNNNSQTLIQAAMFIRMSTFHQQSTIDEHADVIREYAKEQGFEIIRTYVDDRITGQNVAGYDALKKMLNDVASGKADYNVILAYDISCWGPGNNYNKFSHYEDICQRANIVIEYCAELSLQDSFLSVQIFNSIKRRMYEEYAWEMAERLVVGKGFFLEAYQLQSLQDNLAKVTAMTCLVANCVREGKDRAVLKNSIQAAQKSLEKINEMIKDNLPSDNGKIDFQQTKNNSEGPTAHG